MFVRTVLLALLALPLLAAADTPAADTILKDAEAKAKAEHKNVLLDFRASWCPWCVRLDHLLEDPKFGPKYSENYVIAHITVRETAAHRDEENTGWEPLMLKFRKVTDKDIPYVVILTPDGKVLADSYEKKGERIPGNAGFPQTDDEIAAYLDTLRKTAPTFTDEDLTDLKAYFLNVRAHRKSH